MRLTTEVKTTNDIYNGAVHIWNDRGCNWEYAVDGQDITTAAMASGIAQSQIAATLTNQIMQALNEQKEFSLRLSVELIEK